MTEKLKVKLPNGTILSLRGREAWTLQRLMNAGPVGVTTLENPAPRWSHYVFKLRKAGIVISTAQEAHAGSYPGRHGRYRLETPVSVVSGELGGRR